MKRLAIIGCGNIASHHIKSLRSVGFKIVCVASRLNSKTIKSFANKYNIEKYFTNPNELIKSSEMWDALLLSCPTLSMIDYLKKLKHINKPILVEKPITYDYKKLKPFFKKKNIIIAFNRRYYESVKFAKKYVNKNKNLLVKVSIPEQNNFSKDQIYINKLKFSQKTFENSIHIVDIINFIFGEIKWKFRDTITSKDSVINFFAYGECNNNSRIEINNYYNSPSNFSIEILSNTNRLLIEPIEIATLYKKLEIIYDKRNNIKKYVPKADLIIKEKFNNFKPGFYEQSKIFFKFCSNRKINLPKIKNLYESLKMLNQILKN